MSELKPFSTVIEMIRELAEENPHEVADCQYFNDDSTPCCIFGHVFAKLGATPNGRVIQSATRRRVVAEGEGVYEIYWPALGIEQPSSFENQWAADIQDYQDTGSRWPDAIQKADAA
ncbi:hypothetical protein FHT44_004932 [Mycolicibacterium sp. BK634]|uniref:hypothetical protein n=1 Tax=Mycolicibacterium sp. BK634 TaxID=2587099 RepID=UPI0016102428|nr:hypothetical protein [Mycolicibacterium sp. BK634]MBB3752420.1 hypothetical protein [Mycolicibacterium sp. BK634]